MSTVTTTYTYDKGQNRLSKAVSGGATTTYVMGNGGNGAGANQILSSTTSGVTTTYAYDGNGNRTGRTISGTTDVFSYDYENRLTSFNYLTGSSGTGMYTYTYDYRTRRVSRTEPSAGTTYIVFDSGTSIEEYTSTPSSPTVEYIRGFNYGGGVGGLEYSIRSGVSSFNFFDSRGDVVAKTNSSGAITWETAYEAFGNQTTSTPGAPPLDRQRASTKEQDPTGFLNEGFRYRDLSTGTFLTRDPLGFLAGLNNYTYVRQNPWTRFDPEGLLDGPQIPTPTPAQNTTTSSVKGTHDSQGNTTTTIKGSATVGAAPGVTGTIGGTITANTTPLPPASIPSTVPSQPSATAPATKLNPAPTAKGNVQGSAGIGFQITTSLRGTADVSVQDTAKTSTHSGTGAAAGTPSVSASASVKVTPDDKSTATVTGTATQPIPQGGRQPSPTVGGAVGFTDGTSSVNVGVTVPTKGALTPNLSLDAMFQSGPVTFDVKTIYTPSTGARRVDAEFSFQY
jgi:RHS repeat-associated protein